MRGGHGEKNGESPRLIVLGMKGLEKRFLKVMVLANGDKGLFHFRRRCARRYLKEKVQPTPMIEPVKKITTFPRRPELLVAPSPPQIHEEFFRAFLPFFLGGVPSHH